MAPPISLIVATDFFNGISKDNEIPWKIKEDSNYFQDVTKREYKVGKLNVVLMGKNTWLSFPNGDGLKGRINIIISKSLRKETMSSEITVTYHIFPTLETAIQFCQEELDIGHIFICGGKNIYEEALVKYEIENLYITKIYHNFVCNNKFPLDVTAFGQSKYLMQYRLEKSHIFKVKDLNTGLIFDTEFCKYTLLNYNKKTIQNKEEANYLNLLETILRTGHFRQTRNSKTWSIFGKTLEFDLSKGFPLLTTKKVFLRAIFEELLFFLRGDTNAAHLSDMGVKIWDLNTSREFLDANNKSHYHESTLGPMYGYQLKHFGAPYKGFDHDYTGQGFNQIEYCLNLLKTDPFSRRIVMTTFNPDQAKEGVLYPCHGLSIMFSVDSQWKLSCMMFQRSCDSLLGYPFNLASYALLIHLFCDFLNNDKTYTGPKFSVGKLIMNLGDVHIYEDHYSEVIRQILREPYSFPTLSIINRKVTNLTEYKFTDIQLTNYNCYPNIPAKMIA